MSQDEDFRDWPRHFWLSLKRVFAVDLRALAVFRIAVGGTLLCDLFVRMQDLAAHYTDDGVLPVMGLKVLNSPWHFSIHAWSGEAWYQELLFAFAAIAAVSFLVGYQTRIVTFVSWFLLTSLHNRNPYLLHSGDHLLRIILFWLCFLPAGETLSVDRGLNLSFKKLPRQYSSVASAALLLQLVFLYVFVVAHKTGPAWRVDGTAVQYALSLEHLTRPLGHWLLGFPALLKFLTFSVLIFQEVAPLFLLCPWRTQILRLLLAPAFIGMQLGFGFCMYLGIFPWIASFAMIPFLPPVFWDFVSRFFAPRGEIRVYYDRDCGFCRKAVYILRVFWGLPRSSVHHAQTSKAITALMESHNSWVVVDSRGEPHFYFDAFLQVLRASWMGGSLCPVLGLSVVRRVGKHLYCFVAGNRPVFSRLMAPFLFSNAVFKRSHVAEAFAMCILVLVFSWNIFSVDKDMHIPEPFHRLGQVLRVEQNWNMFSPDPQRDDGWFVILGKLQDGSQIDFFRGGRPVDWEKPDAMAELYKNNHWQKLMTNGVRKDRQGYMTSLLARYYCGKRRDIATVDVFYMEYRTALREEERRVTPRLLTTLNCADLPTARLNEN